MRTLMLLQQRKQMKLCTKSGTLNGCEGA